MTSPRAPALCCRRLVPVSLRLLPRIRATLAGALLALAGCAQGPVVAPVAEVIVPPAPPLSSAEAAVAAPSDEPEREPRRAKVAGDLRPVILRIVHTAKRAKDAEFISKRLTSLGATVRLYPTSDDLNEPHAGHLYVKDGFEKYAPLIVRAVADLEPEEIVSENNLEGDHNLVLWVVR